MSFPEVYLIAKPIVYWADYLSITQQGLKRSVTKTLDARGEKITSSTAFIKTLGELLLPDSNPQDVLTNPGHILQHVSYSLLVIANSQTVFEVLQCTPLSCVSTVTVRPPIQIAVLTGTLEQWRTAIINGCTALVSDEVRILMDKCLVLFDKEGFSKMWEKYTRVHNSDNTITLRGNG